MIPILIEDTLFFNSYIYYTIEWETKYCIIVSVQNLFKRRDLISMKKFIEITNEVTSKIFECEKREGGEVQPSPIDLPLQAIIDMGISNAIPRALYLLMEKDPKEEVSIEVGPFTYGISMRKTGDSLSLNPTFSLTNEKKTINELGEFEEKLQKNISMVEAMAGTIKDEQLINTVIHCCKLDEFDTTKGEWIEKIEDADKGLEPDSYSAVLFIAIHIATILHVLSSMKKAEELVKYEVPGEGTYTIQQVKGKYQIGFIASKEFKQAIKNDRLVDSLAS